MDDPFVPSLILEEAVKQLDGTSPWELPVSFQVLTLGDDFELQGMVTAVNEMFFSEVALNLSLIQDEGYFGQLAYMMGCMRQVVTQLNGIIRERFRFNQDWYGDDSPIFAPDPTAPGRYAQFTHTGQRVVSREDAQRLREKLRSAEVNNTLFERIRSKIYGSGWNG